MAIYLYFVCWLTWLTAPAADFCLSEEEHRLAKALMQVRADNGYAPLPLSVSLSYVAHLHSKDLAEHYDPNNSSGCLPTGWSENGSWQACCIQPKHPAGNCMWKKPAELTEYTGNGYEVVVFVPDSLLQGAPSALLTYLTQDESLRSMLLEQGWGGWKAFGIGLTGNYLCLWAGHQADPAGQLDPCPSDAPTSDPDRDISLQTTTDASSLREADQSKTDTDEDPPPIEVSPQKRYYLIVSSHVRPSDAQQALQQRLDAFPNAKILSSESHHRLSLDDFEQLSPAKKRRNELQSQFADLWILPHPQ
ncbi:MAG: CAP domain-containing protein [Bernardetiaceae bacterium]